MLHSTEKQRPRILIVWWYSLLTIGGTAAAVASFFYLRDLAEYAGWTDYRAWLVPVSLDVLAAAALTAWVYSKRSDWRPFTISLALVLGSGIGNALSHLYGTHHWQPTAPVIVAVGVVPVIAFFVIADLLVRARRDSWFTQQPNTDLQPSALDLGGTPGQMDTSARSSAAQSPATAPTSSPTGSASATTATPTSVNTTTRRSSAPKKPRRSGSPSRKQRTPSQPLSVLLQRVETEQLRNLSKTQLVNHLGIGWPTVNQLWPLIHPEPSSPASLSPNGTSPVTTSPNR